MKIVAIVLTAIVALLHIAFGVAEMFYWQHPVVAARFGSTPEFAKMTTVLAANQGIYNVLLAAALLWALINANHTMRTAMLLFVIVAGIFGAATAKPTIFYVQSLPAILALLASWAAVRRQ